MYLACIQLVLHSQLFVVDEWITPELQLGFLKVFEGSVIPTGGGDGG